MRFLVDECAGPKVAERLRGRAHEVFSVYDEARGMGDDDVLQKAYTERWILIANDKDSGEMVYRERRPHRGVIFMRLDDERSAHKIDVLRRLLELYEDKLPDQFVVVTDSRVRFGRA